MEHSMMLSKESSNEQIKQYFVAVLKMKQSGEEFPVNLDEVWPLVYKFKHKAVEELKKNFIESVDYQVLTQKGEMKSSRDDGRGGRIPLKYKLTTSCLEYFIARKMRGVFEVYRQVFHKATEALALPQTFAEALYLAAQQAEQIEQQQKAIEASRPLVEFANTIADSSDAISMGDFAKLVYSETKMGRNNMFTWLRDAKVLDKQNHPYQRYIENGWFKIIEQTFNTPYKTGVNLKTLVTGKGQISIIEKIKAELR